MNNELKLTPKMLGKLSLIINKMEVSKAILDLKIESTNDDANEKLIKEILSLAINNLYKATDEIVEFIVDYKQISKEEAENVDVISLIKELLENEKIRSFLKLV